VDGRFVPISRARVAIEDRGYQFADGVYEVIKALDGEPRDLDRHLVRLERSLGELRIPPPMSMRALALVIREALARNPLRKAIVYLQVTRGVAPRNHLFPSRVRPSLVITVRRAPFPTDRERAEGVAVLSLPDQRWGRCDIKSISLLANLLAKQQAAEAGCREAWLVDREGRVTEGSASNAYIVDGEGRLVTHPLGPRILGGITRSVVLELAREAGIEVEERPFTLEEAKRAREAFLTSTTSLLLPVTRIDEQVVANGAPGSITRRLARLYAERVGIEEAAAGL
ncbi:MAG TPA: D-amino-acid transaminase, partial [Rhodospirillales bacterium]|nr:D-amino-acid transaminase [Rhodospirillales bacterium]